jgi:hypothetical protein
MPIQADPDAQPAAHEWDLESTLTVSILGFFGLLAVCIMVVFSYHAIKDRHSRYFSNRASVQARLANRDAAFEVELQAIIHGRVVEPPNDQASSPNDQASPHQSALAPGRVNSHRGGNRSGGSRRHSIPLRANPVYPNGAPPRLSVRNSGGQWPSPSAHLAERASGNGGLHGRSQSFDGSLNYAAGSQETLPKYEIGVPPPVYRQG